MIDLPLGKEECKWRHGIAMNNKHFQQIMDQPDMVAKPARGQPVPWYHDNTTGITNFLRYYLPLALYETDQSPDATDNF